MEIRRVFLIVLDSFGIGELPDAGRFGDEGSNTLASIAKSRWYHTPCLSRLGLFNIEGVECLPGEKAPLGAFARMGEASMGKDTTTGHWEIAGLLSPRPMPTYPNGFPPEVLEPFQRQTGRGVLCNRPYSGTEVIQDYGQEHLRTGDLIVYTSADSVFQIAAHEDQVPLEELYEDCRIARRILRGRHGVGRVIARPFTGGPGSFARTAGRHDFSLDPPGETMLDVLHKAALTIYGVGKISDIFAGRGISRGESTVGNRDGMEKTLRIQEEDFEGLCFVNLVDFDTEYGHRNDVDGYARAASEFDGMLEEFLKGMRLGDVLIITADHGCDPGTLSTDHSREYVPMLAFGAGVEPGVSLGTRDSFADIGATVLEMFGLSGQISGKSFWRRIKKNG